MSSGKLLFLFFFNYKFHEFANVFSYQYQGYTPEVQKLKREMTIHLQSSNACLTKFSFLISLIVTMTSTLKKNTKQALIFFNTSSESMIYIHIILKSF